MFIGRFAVGFAAKRFAPRASLGLLIAAPLFLDMLWPIFLLLGWEHARIAPGDTRYTPFDLYDYPWSHSLLMAAVWATAFALIYFGVARYKAGAVAMWIGVVSHWVLDWITHRPDMPWYPGGSARLGLGLWNSIAGTMVVETGMLAVGVGLYVSATRARDWIGRYAFAVYVVLLLGLYVSDRFSPPSDSMNEVAWVGVAAMVVMLPWAWWFDRHRDLRANVAAAARG
jgi:membrane-bound metal-dependent hydrolase YbcI (DUF457 family)